MTDLFKRGDTVRVIDGGTRLDSACDLGVPNGSILTVLEDQEHGYGGVLVGWSETANPVVNQGIKFWTADRFQKVDQIDIPVFNSGEVLYTPGHRAPDVLVVDPAPVHTRSYDHNAGDQRFFGREEAIAQAQLRVRDRGCRQQVRPATVQPGDEALVPRWLVQDI